MAGESTFWQWLSGARKHFRESLHINRIENIAMAGMPDVEGQLDKEQFWAELKSTRRPARPETPIRFDMKKREKQIEFMRRRYSMGSNCFWLLRVTGGTIGTMVYMLPGDKGHLLTPGILERDLALACVEGGMIFSKNSKPNEIIWGLVKCRRHPFL